MRLALVLAPVFAFGLAERISAQDESASKARLDEFQLSFDRPDSRIEQLEDNLAPLPEGDNGVAPPAPWRLRREPVLQLSPTREAGTTQQVSNRDAAPADARGAISSRIDSRPRPTVPLVGADRCDPQGVARRSPDCLRILELRAAEFGAVRAPTLSAEQALLAQRNGDSFLGPESRTTLMLVSKANPDAGSQSNQALASIALAPRNTQAEPQEDSAVTKEMVEALRGLQIEIPAPAVQ